MKRIKLTLIFMVVALFLLTNSLQALGCTSFPTGKDASVDGSTMITIHQDTASYEFHLLRWPAKDHEPGTMKRLYDWPQWMRWFDKYGNATDPRHEFTGAEIPEVSHTYSYTMGLFPVMNENQVSMGMSTLTGIHDALWNDEAKLRITTLPMVAAERAKTAREVIQIVASLAEEYGFRGEYTPGKCLIIADPNEIWLLHIMAVGPLWTPGCGEPGAVWVAQRVPDDHVAVFPNGFSIGEIDLDDPDNFMASSNIKSLAIEMGWYDPESGLPFSAVEAYTGGRALPMGTLTRKWQGYQLIKPSLDLPNPDEMSTMKGPHGYQYRYPFSVKPDKKISVADLMKINRNVLEGTYLDLTKGPLGGPFGSPTRTLGTFFKVDEEIVQEGRGIQGDVTQYTQVCQMRSWLPNEIGGIAWWAPGRPKTSFYVPFYLAGMNEITDQYTTGNHFEMEWGKTAYWATTFVNTFAEVMYCYIIEDVKKMQDEIESEAFSIVPAIDKAALELYKSDPKKAREFLTQWCNQFAEDATKRYWEFANHLVVKYHHKYINEPEIATKPKMPEEEYWIKQAFEYQKEVRKRVLPEVGEQLW